MTITIMKNILQNTFQTIVQPSSSKHSFNLLKQKKKEKTSFKDEEVYINYQPKDHHSEAGWVLVVNQSVLVSEQIVPGSNFRRFPQHSSVKASGIESFLETNVLQTQVFSDGYWTIAAIASIHV